MVRLTIVVLAFCFSMDAKAETYTIEEGDNWSIISYRLYGTVKKAAQIAQWNGAQTSSRLSAGKKLILQEPPKLTPEQGDRLLYKMWSHLQNKRHSGESVDLPTTPIPYDANVAKQIQEEEESLPMDSGQRALKTVEEKLIAGTADASEAVPLLNQASEENPNDPAPLIYKLAIQVKASQNKEARHTAEKLVSISPQYCAIAIVKKALGTDSSQCPESH